MQETTELTIAQYLREKALKDSGVLDILEDIETMRRARKAEIENYQRMLLGDIEYDRYKARKAEKQLAVIEKCDRNHIDDMVAFEKRVKAAATKEVLAAITPQLSGQASNPEDLDFFIEDEEAVMYRFHGEEYTLGTLNSAPGKLAQLLFVESSLERSLPIDKVFAEIYNTTRGASSSSRYKFDDFEQSEKKHIIRSNIKELQRGGNLRRLNIEISVTDMSVIAHRVEN